MGESRAIARRHWRSLVAKGLTTGEMNLRLKNEAKRLKKTVNIRNPFITPTHKSSGETDSPASVAQELARTAIAEDPQQTPQQMQIYGLQTEGCLPHHNSTSILYHFPYHQTSPTVVSLGGLTEIMQSKSTLSCDNIQIHSLFRHGFIKKPKSKFNRSRK